MKCLRGFLCVLLAICFAWAMADFPELFPLSSESLIAEKYEGWSGVIRVWYCGGWADGLPGILSWLNRCAGPFEKNHDGVYIQVQSVEASAISGICENGIIPPDIVIFPPGLFEAPRHLIPLCETAPLRAGLCGLGSYCGITYALPIVMSGYAWALNTGILHSVPDTWANTEIVLSIPPDDACSRWSAALAGLCSGAYIPDSGAGTQNNPVFDLDLGLELPESTPAPTHTPVPSDADLQYCRLPTDFSASGNAWDRFLSGETAAIPVSSEHLRRLESLSGQGKGPDWEIAVSGDIAFTDRILFAGITDRDSDPGKINLCRDFILHLLLDSSQAALSATGAFSVTEAPSGYAVQDSAAVIEHMLRSKPLCAVPAFDDSFSDKLDSIVREFFFKKAFYPALYRQFRDLSR